MNNSKLKHLKKELAFATIFTCFILVSFLILFNYDHPIKWVIFSFVFIGAYMIINAYIKITKLKQDKRK